jgi:hypothetical protein
MRIGYARVSTDDQNLDLQRDALRKSGCKRIYEDRISGAKAARPGLQTALEQRCGRIEITRFSLQQRSEDEVCCYYVALQCGWMG